MKKKSGAHYIVSFSLNEEDKENLELAKKKKKMIDILRDGIALVNKND